MMQESHSVESDHEQWQNELEGYKLYLNSGTSMARGTLFGISKNFDLQNIKYYDDGDGRLQILSGVHDDQKFLFINIYNFNYQSEQVKLLKTLNEKLTQFNQNLDHQIICGGDWNFVNDKTKDTYNCTQPPKLKSIAELTNITENHDLCEIFRIRNPDKKLYTFRANTPRRMSRLDFYMISNSLQESIGKCEILNSVSSDHNPVLLSIKSPYDSKKNTAYWKFNTSLLKNNDFITELKTEIENMKANLNEFEPQKKWELMKYKIRCFCIEFSKKIAKKRRDEFEKLEQIIRDHETTEIGTNEIYVKAKLEYERLLNQKSEGVILRSKIKIYEENEKSSKYFLSLEKHNAVRNTIKMLKSPENDDEITNPKDVVKEIRSFYSNLFKLQKNQTREKCDQFLDTLDLPRIPNDLNENLKKPLSLDEMKEVLKTSVKGKSPGNDGLGSEFYIVFWENISEQLFESFNDGLRNGILSPSQRQAVIKLLEKKGKDKRYISNWRPISLINFDTKILAKCLAKRMKEVLPKIIKNDQTAYVANRFLGESVRLISDVLNIAKTLNIDGYLMTVDIQKAFDSVDHNFMYACLKRFGFDESFIRWIRVLYEKQESCVLNGGHSTGYFPLQRGVRQGDPISAYLFIIVIEVFFNMVRNNPKVEGLNILGFEYLLTSYADDTTFFIKDEKSAIEIFNTFDIFSKYSGLSINKSKCEIAGIGVKNGAKVALLGAKCINLNSDYIKILGVCFSYNEEIFKEKNYTEVIKKMESVLAIWRWRNLSLSGKIMVFKSLVFSKIIFISFLNKVPNGIIKKIQEIQQDFIWDGKTPKVKHSAMIGNYEDGGLKNLDILTKFDSLRLSWVRRLFDDKFHPWKNIPLKLIKQQFNQSIFYPNIQIKFSSDFPKFYHEIAKSWSKMTQEPLTCNSVLSQSIWFNNFIRIGGKVIKKRFDNELFVSDLYVGNKLLNWQAFKTKFDLRQQDHFTWIQIINALPQKWKKIIEDSQNVIHPQRFQHLLMLTREIPLEKLTSKYIYTMKIMKIKDTPTSQVNIETQIQENNLNWETLYTCGRTCTIDSYTRSFDFKCTHNILFLNKMLFKWKKVASPLCSFCKQEDENILHLFSKCCYVKSLWSQLNAKITVQLPPITPKSAFFGYPDSSKLINHIHLIFRIAVYKCRSLFTCNVQYILSKIKNAKQIEENISLSKPTLREKFIKKWSVFAVLPTNAE